MRANSILTLLLAAAPLAALAEGDSPWLPIPGQLSLGISASLQRGTDAYIGDQKVSLTDITGGAGSDFRRTATTVRFDYGLTDSVALDFSLGYGRVTAGAADSDKGMTDSVAGLRWRVLDELEDPAVPTLTLRAAAIVKGGYDGGRLAGLGNAANGIELAAVIGKQLSKDWSAWAELGYQNRDKNVPNAVFFELGARYHFAPRWSASAAYANKRYGGDLDIGGPGFTPARFQEVREERQLAKLGLGYAITGNQGVALGVTGFIKGRNTVKDTTSVNLAYVYAF